MIKPAKIIRVLVVDDSSLVRDVIRSILESSPGIVVAGEAANGLEGFRMAVALKPDIVTMDIEMPVMGGLEAIERIMAEYPVPILVVTSLTGVRTAYSAVSKGALHVIEKPDTGEIQANNLIKMIRRLSGVNVLSSMQAVNKRAEPGCPDKTAFRKSTSPTGGILAIAASTGGPKAIHYILSELPDNFPLPIVVAQHIAEGFTEGMVEWLNTAGSLEVCVAASGDRLAAGKVYINPPEHSMRISDRGKVILGERSSSRQLYNPSCNTLLSSVASAYRENSIALIMSGMGDDGVAGIQEVKAAGGITIAQDAKSSVVYGMNRIAVDRGYIQKVVPLADIPDELIRYSADIS